MSKLLMLGTGNGGTQKLYNTSFVIQNEQGNFLIDTGGSVEVVERLKHFNIDLKDLKNIFISHSHIDHIMGLIWIFKKLGRYIKEGSIKDKINIYGNDEVIFAIKSVANLVLPEKLVKIVFDIINFCPLKDGDSILINDIKYNFFDIKAKGVKQFGFDCIIDERKLVFLGDETFNLELAWRVRDAFFVMHEAFCLDSEENIFHAYEKNHSTVKKACLMMDELNVKCLILYHTEESHSINKKKLYLEEGKQYFHKILLVPNDLDIIDLSMIDKVGGVILKDKKILVQRKKIIE